MILHFRLYDKEHEEMEYFEDYSELSYMFKGLDTDWDLYEEPMQSTGLRDINGKEIYIGDLVKCDISNDFINGNVYEVIDNAFELILKNEFKVFNKLSLQKCIDYVEVIGNIFQNPHLLEADSHD